MFRAALAYAVLFFVTMFQGAVIWAFFRGLIGGVGLVLLFIYG